MVNLKESARQIAPSKAMFTLYRLGFCSVSKVAPVQCEQELMFCCGAEIVPKRSQCDRVRTAQGKSGKRDFFEKNQGKPGNSGNFLTISTTQGILFCQISLIK